MSDYDDEFDGPDDGAQNYDLSRHGKSWTQKETARLVELYHGGLTVAAAAATLKRTIVACKMKWISLEQDEVVLRLYGVGFNTWHAPATENQIRIDTSRQRQIMNSVNSPKLMEKYVNLNHLITLLQKGYTTCEVSFVNPQPFSKDQVSKGQLQLYTYKISDKLKDLGCDRCVVENSKGNLVVAWILTIHTSPQIDVSAPYSYKWVVDVVREQDYDDQMHREKEAMQMLQDGERARAQKDAMEALLATVPNREELLKLLGN